ncbi:MAG: PD-(D/E)XK nuclease family protein [Lachnospiraceae bacterium]
MGLQFMLGTALADRQKYLYQPLIETSRKNPKEVYKVIVPEQATLQVQRELIWLHPGHVLTNIDVLSFDRLAFRIIEELNLTLPAILDDTGKAMILRRSAEGQKEKLAVYSANLNRSGFIGELKSQLSEFLQYGIKREQLENVADAQGISALLQQKLKDLSVLYEQFEKDLEGAYITTEELLPTLCQIISQSEMVHKSHFVLDGFTGFTPVQFELLALLLKHSVDVTVCITVGNGKDIHRAVAEHDLFYMSHSMAQQLNELAVKVGVERKNDIWMKEKQNLPDEMFHLERNLFRYPAYAYPEKVSHIGMVCGTNPANEMEAVLRQIQRLLREKKFRYRDIAIVTGDLEQYGEAAKRCFARAEIPLFVDQNKGLSGNPLVELIQSVLETIDKNFSYDTMFRYLRNCLSGVEREEVDILENYCLALGVRGRNKWKKEWTYLYGELTEEELKHINELREEIWSNLENLDKFMRRKKGTVREKTESLYTFLKDLRAEEQILSMAAEFEKEREFLFQREYEQVFGKVIGLFDQLVQLMGENEIPLDDYRDMLKSGFENLQVGLIPPSVDRLIMGDLQRTRLGDVKALFVVGVNDGIVPKSGEKGGLLSELDREQLERMEIHLSPSIKQEGFFQKYYLYLMLTKPSQYLCLSWSTHSSDGKQARPSYLIHLMKNLFPTIRQQEGDALGLESTISPKLSIPFLIEGMKQSMEGTGEDWWKELYGWYLRHGWKEKIDQLIEAVFLSYQGECLNQRLARELVGTTPLNSVTRLERFAACQYAYFLAYGLGLRSRKEYELAAMDYGTIFHSALNLYFHKMSEHGVDLKTAREEQRKSWVKESIDEVTETYNNTIMQSSARNEYLKERMEQMLDRTVWALGEQMQRGDFETAGSEVNFSERDNLSSMELTLADGMKMTLQGKIDRLDIAEEEKELLVKIIDYKTGTSSLDMTKFYYGLQLQLIVYMAAAMEIEQKRYPDKAVIPAGVYYYNIKNPLVEHPSSGGAESIEDEMLDSLKLTGLTNASPGVIQKLDHTMEEKSKVIDKLGSRNPELAEEGDLKRMCQYALDKATEIGSDLVRGEINVLPYEYKNKRPCSYCEFRGVCGFDSAINGYRYRRLKNFTPDELWDILKDLYEKKEN